MKRALAYFAWWWLLLMLMLWMILYELRTMNKVIDRINQQLGLIEKTLKTP